MAASLTDAELLDAIGQGDRTALRTLYDRHAPWLTLRLARRCRDSGTVEEAVQDTFTAVWRRPDGYRGDGQVAAWLWGIAVRRLIDQLRRTPTHRLVPRPDDDLVLATEDRLLEGVEHGDLAAVLGRLSPELIAVVQATVLDGLTTREAAQLLAIPTGTVKTRMARARRQMRESLA